MVLQMDLQATEDEQLKNQGWKLASVTGGAHLKRTLEMYDELGIDVRLVEASPDECQGCAECYREENSPVYRIYTRSTSGTQLKAEAPEHLRD